MEYYLAGECIECERAEIFAKKFTKGPPIQHPEFGKVIKLTGSRDGSAEIMEEIHPKQELIVKHSKRVLGSILRAERFYAFLKGTRVPAIDVENHSGRHKSQKINTRSFTFAEISVPFASIANALDKRIANP